MKEQSPKSVYKHSFFTEIILLKTNRLMVDTFAKV